MTGLELKNKIIALSKMLGINQKKTRLVELKSQSIAPDFWQNQIQAVQISSEIADLETEVNEFESLEVFADEQNLEPEDILEAENILSRLEAKTLLAGHHDRDGAILSIHAGTGGVEAMDWAMMLERMYLRFLERDANLRIGANAADNNQIFSIDRSGWRVEIVDRHLGDEAGIKSATVIIRGRYAFGLLKQEAGVHRLVRLSPFNAQNLRQTSFALVEVLPFIDNAQDEVASRLVIPDRDLKVDTFRSSGAGGQHVNVTDSAVRITHLPTGTVVSVQNERSQHQNRETAVNILRSKLVNLLEIEKKEKLEELRGEHKQAVWGNQIRSYVLQPYKLVKDHRTEYETANVDEVLDGKIDGFIDAELKIRN